MTTNMSHFQRPKHVHLLRNNRTQRGMAHLASEELKDGVANFGFPERERFRTNFTDSFGKAALSDNCPPEICNKVISDSQLPFVQRFLEGAPPQHRAQFGNAIRSLQSLRKMGKGARTSTQEGLDVDENTRLWVPAPTQGPPPGAQTRSQVPLGGKSLTAATLRNSDLSQQLPAIEKVSASFNRPPPSPSVSNLSSVNLTPPGTAGTRAGFGSTGF
jgi:hypothetical protein